MRRADWLARLVAVIEDWRCRPFVYGAVDCGRFGAACVEAVTGERFEMPYRTRAEARRWLRGGDVAAQITARLGASCEGLPRRGDVCLVETVDGPGVGVAVGVQIAVPGERGLTFQPLVPGRHWRL